MDFRILGPLEVASNGRLVSVGGTRQVVTLAMLLLDEGRVVSVDRLIYAIWDDDPPPTARAQIQICISRLRRLLARESGADPISTRHPGYLLRLGDDTLDSRIFESGVATGRQLFSAGSVAQAVAHYRSALSLWRGPALSGIESELVRSSVLHIEELRLAATEECVEAELLVDPRQDLVSDLVRLTHDYPLREHLHALLMIALHRAGRQAEALEVYRKTRTIMLDELGIEPGRELQQLQMAILNGDEVSVYGTERAAEPATVTSSSAMPGFAVPRLLPAALPGFVGRRLLLAELLEVARPAPPSPSTPHALLVSIVFGRGGVGKTTLVLQAAHQLAANFPDGQLFARLRAGDRPVSPTEVLERFLRALGVDGASIPEDLERRAEMYRNLLGSRTVLVVLDDAMSEQQVSYLLPGNPQCSVLVTSGRRLTGIPVTARFEVGVLTPDSAVKLLAGALGPNRVKAEPQAAVTLCALCGYLPLALRVVAARLAARPHWRIATLAERLDDESRRLDELNHGDMGVRASISMTYGALSADARLLFRRLAVSEAPNFASWVGTPLLETDFRRAEDLLEELTESYLIDIEPGPTGEPPRYRYHDTMRPFAYERLIEEESPKERRAALERLVGALLTLAREAHKREYAGDYLLPASSAPRWPLPPALVDRLLKIPLAWYEQERTSLSAAVWQAAASGLAEYSWDLAISSVALYETRSYFSDWRETHEAALKAACGAGDLQGEAAMRYSLGSLHMFEQQNEQAMLQFNRALELYAQLGEQQGTALVLRNIAVLDRRKGDLAAARERWETALGIFQIFGDRIAEAYVLCNLARMELDLGHDEAARHRLSRAADICQQTGNRRVGAQVQNQFGELRLRAADYEGAAEAYGTVIALTREMGDRVGECYGTIGLATIDLRRSDFETATQTLTGALSLAELVGERMIRCRAMLAMTEAQLGLGRHEHATAYADQAVNIAREIGANLVTAQALVARARVHLARGAQRAAKSDLQHAELVLTGTPADMVVAAYAQIQQLQSELSVSQ